MFASALAKANAFTQPVIISTLLHNGEVRCGCGAFVVLNPEGWIVTAAHIFNTLVTANLHKAEIAAYDAEVARIQAIPGLKAKHVKSKIDRVSRNPEWIVNHSYFWNEATIRVTDIYAESGCDIAIARMQPFDPAWVTEYPVLRDPTQPMPVGTSLCRLGFPFHAIKATFDATTNMFTLANGVLPVPRFPNDGIHTQVVQCNHPDGTTGKFIQTSTPGLKGQSGGPIFDTQGRIWAIQSQTRSLPLDFAPILKHNGKDFVEHQFMNVGWGSHVEELVRILDQKGIKYNKSA